MMQIYSSLFSERVSSAGVQDVDQRGGREEEEEEEDEGEFHRSLMTSLCQSTVIINSLEGQNLGSHPASCHLAAEKTRKCNM